MTTSANLASVSPVVAPQVPAAPAGDAAASGQDGAATGFATALASQVDLLKKGAAGDAKAIDELLAGLAEQVADQTAGSAVPASPIDTSLLQAWIAQALPQAQPQPTAPAQVLASPDGAAVQPALVADARGRFAPGQAASVQAGEPAAIPDMPAPPGVPAAKDIVVPAPGAPAQFAAAPVAAAEAAIAKPVAEAEPAAAADLPLPGAENITHAAARPAHAAQESQPTPGARIESALGSRQWTEDVGQRIVWAAGRGESRAELVLHPPHLGRVEVAITVSSSGDSTALFVSANPQVRDALEQSLPRLREIMAEAGIALGQASVQSDSAPRDDREQQNGPAAGGRLRAGAADLPLAEPGPARQGNRMVDIFA